MMGLTFCSAHLGPTRSHMFLMKSRQPTHIKSRPRPRSSRRRALVQIRMQEILYTDEVFLLLSRARFIQERHCTTDEVSMSS